MISMNIKSPKRFHHNAIAIVMSIVIVCTILISCKNNSSVLIENTSYTSKNTNVYLPVLATTKNIQANSNYIYFAGTKSGIFKYDIITDQVSNYCTDPLCNHHSQNASCRIDNCQRGMFFRANNNILLYNAAIVNDKYGKITPHLYRFDSGTISNVLLDSNASSSNYYTSSDEYVYFTNTVIKNDKTYFCLLYTSDAADD